MTRTVCIIAGILLPLPALAWAQTFPSKTVKITTPYSSGAGGDLLTRALAEVLRKEWRQPLVVEAKPGASGMIAINSVKKSVPDGHELIVLADPQLTINPNLVKDLPYDPESDFVPIAGLAKITFLAVVKSDGPYQTMKQLIAGAKAEPSKVSYGIPGLGTTSHLAGALFEHDTGARMLNVPFKEQTQLFTTIANGGITWTLATSGATAPMVQAGLLKLIAVAAEKRLASHPDIPTMEESAGLKDFVVEHWIGLFALRGTPKDVVTRLQGDLRKVLATKEMQERSSVLGFEPLSLSPEEIAAKIRADRRKNAEVISQVGMKTR